MRRTISQILNVSRLALQLSSQSQNLNVSRLALQLSSQSIEHVEAMCYIENEDVNVLEQRRQAMLQLHLSDQKNFAY